MPHKIRPLSRGASKIAPTQKFFLFCEGERTEPDYFDAIARSKEYSLVEIVSVRAAVVPLTIADLAAAKSRELKRGRRESYEKRDQVWAVFDRDEHPGFAEAIERCSNAGVGVARSNPCFEVWLILHFQNYDSPDHRHQTQSHFATICSDYDPARHKTTDCSKLVARVEDAERRAEAQLEARKNEGDAFGAPSTTVFELTRRLRGI